MTISIQTLIVTGPDKRPAKLLLDEKSHLVFGPTDTGKSYIVECLRFCFGGGEKPKGVGYSDGYTRASVQITVLNVGRFTIFRDLATKYETVFEGFHESPPQNSIPLDEELSKLLVTWSGATDKKILAKAGTLSNFTASDLRRHSFFDEIETLDNVPFEGKDKITKTRNKSSLAMILSGSDDSDMTLPPSTNERNIAKGHVEAIGEQIVSLLADIPKDLSLIEANDSLKKVSSSIEDINFYIQSHNAEINELKNTRIQLIKKERILTQEYAALKEAESRFELLETKYVSDQQRLQAISTAASITESFEIHPCPLCFTDLQHQRRHEAQENNTHILRKAALVEHEKISKLRTGLNDALVDVRVNIDEKAIELAEIQSSLGINERQQNELLKSNISDNKFGLQTLSDRKVELSVAVANYAKVDELRIKLAEMTNRSKRQKQIVNRDLSESSNSLCVRVKALLDEWGVPDVDSIYFDESVADLEVNQRKRTSYGKGKRGIFLTAFMVALMERASAKKHPHLGFLIIDSPVVTYKDPKHGPNSDSDELLDETVKDRFYSWLANRSEPGQILILENEEPKEEVPLSLNVTEFVGLSGITGRKGFFPI